MIIKVWDASIDMQVCVWDGCNYPAAARDAELCQGHADALDELLATQKTQDEKWWGYGR